MGIYKPKGCKVWWMTFSHGGRQIRSSTKTRDKRLAEKVYSKVLTQVTEGRWFETDKGAKTTFEELLDKYLAEHSPKKAPNSWRRDQGTSKHLKGYFSSYFLTDNPRTIKRVVNLFRFHYSMSVDRMTNNLPTATPEQLVCWSVLLVRWPNFVRWIQAERARAEQRASDKEWVESETVKKVVAKALEANETLIWSRALDEIGVIDHSWKEDGDLFQFLKKCQDIDLAGKYGVW